MTAKTFRLGRIQPALQAIIRAELDTDIGSGDATSLALVPRNAVSCAEIVAKQSCVLSGLDVAAKVLRTADRKIVCRKLARDGAKLRRNQRVMVIRGPARGILAGERTALNFLQRMSGIATLTSRFRQTAGRSRTAILDTRKTTPGLRFLEKYAVLCGGGKNHRIGLHDRVLIKDNHRRLWTGGRNASLADAVREARKKYPKLMIEIEVENIPEFRDALRANPEWILLDNMKPAVMRRIVKLNQGRTRLEASGGITLANIRAVAGSGVDAVSLGCLTHSAPAADFSLEFVK